MSACRDISHIGAYLCVGALVIFEQMSALGHWSTMAILEKMSALGHWSYWSKCLRWDIGHIGANVCIEILIILEQMSA